MRSFVTLFDNFNDISTFTIELGFIGKQNFRELSDTRRYIPVPGGFGLKPGNSSLFDSKVTRTR